MPIIALYDNVIIRRIESPNTTASGLIISSTSSPDQWTGEVVATGEGKILQDGCLFPLTVKEGDKVIISTKSEYRAPISVDGEELYAFKEHELVGIIYPYGTELNNSFGIDEELEDEGEEEEE